MTFPVRRTVLASLVVAGVFAACGYTRVDEAQVRARGAERLSCDEQLVKLEGAEGPAAGVARYEVRGCGRSTTLDCTADDAGVVACWRAGRSTAAPTDEDEEDDSPGAEFTAAAVGCACASLFASHGRSSHRSHPSSDPPPTSTTTSSSSGAVPLDTTPRK